MKKLLMAMLCLVGVMSSSFAGITITQDGTIIENQYISGQVNVKAHNVIIRNCELDGGGTSLYGVSCKYYDSNGQPYKGTLIENCHIHDYGVGVLAHYTTIRRCNIHDSQTDAIKARSGCLIERNWCHHIGKKVGAHADCVQIREGSNIIIRNNHFDIPISQTGGSGGYKSNACLIIAGELGPVSNVVIENNRMEGGNYTVYLESKTYRCTQVKLHDNYFGPDFRYGVLAGKGLSWKQRRISIDRNDWFDGTFMAINYWDNDNK
jgi:hypothetical protein